MNSLRRKTIVLRPILGMSPGFALAVVVCIVAVGVFAAVMLDDISRGAKKSPSVVSATNANFEQPAATIVRSHTADSSVAWLRHSAPFPTDDPAPRMAIVVVDDGSDATAALSAMRLSAPLTLAIAPTADAAARRAEAARRYGREVLLLLPMQAEEKFDDTPNPIAIHVPHSELNRRMNWNLAQIDGYVGVMNSFGEATTRDAGTMRAVLEVVKSKGLSFIDSRAHKDSVASAVAGRMGVPTGDRVVAIDAGSSVQDFEVGLNTGLRHAERWGTSIVTIPADRKLIAALQDWIAEAPSEVRLAPVTAVIKRLRSSKT